MGRPRPLSSRARLTAADEVSGIFRPSQRQAKLVCSHERSGATRGCTHQCGRADAALARPGRYACIMVAASLLSRFAGTAFCAGLTPAEVEALFELCEVRKFNPGVSLFREGQRADALWVVLEGDVEVSREGQTLAEVGPGAVLGEMSLFRAAPSRSASVTAICLVVALRISGPQFQKRVAQFDLAALKVVSNLAHQMAERLVAVNERLTDGGKKGLTVVRRELRRLVG
jgi:CRP-like cAMP-binding protein